MSKTRKDTFPHATHFPYQISMTCRFGRRGYESQAKISYIFISAQPPFGASINDQVRTHQGEGGGGGVKVFYIFPLLHAQKRGGGGPYSM